jgi:hypothetical protein
MMKGNTKALSILLETITRRLNLPPEFPTAILLVSVEDLEKSCNDSNIEHLTLFLRER